MTRKRRVIMIRNILLSWRVRRMVMRAWRKPWMVTRNILLLRMVMVKRKMRWKRWKRRLERRWKDLLRRRHIYKRRNIIHINPLP